MKIGGKPRWPFVDGNPFVGTSGGVLRSTFYLYGQKRQNRFWQRLPDSEIYLSDWTSIGIGGLGVATKIANHSGAAVFVDWLLNKEGQTVLANAYGSKKSLRRLRNKELFSEAKIATY